MSYYWQIVADEEYIQQVAKLPLGRQSQILTKWLDVAQHENPRDVGYTDDCGKGDEECPYIVVRFQEIPCEFVYLMDKANRTITLISCERLAFLEGGQAE